MFTLQLYIYLYALCLYYGMRLCESSIKKQRNDNGFTYNTDREYTTLIFKGKRHQIEYRVYR